MVVWQSFEHPPVPILSNLVTPKEDVIILLFRDYLCAGRVALDVGDVVYQERYHHGSDRRSTRCGESPIIRPA